MATDSDARRFPLVIHATHEAGLKLGGIGAVLDGLLNNAVYAAAVERSILVGPMFAGDAAHMERLSHPRSGIEIAYSSLHGLTGGVSETVRLALQRVEQTFAVALFYGTRRFGDYTHEILLVDATAPNLVEIDRFKFYVWQRYGIDSGRYNWSSEYNLYFAVAQPIFSALKALEVDAGLSADDKFIIAHEWLGMPVVFAAQLNEPQRWRTIFYAHETTTARRLVEEHDGHDTRFYNALEQGRAWAMSLDDVFGDQHDLFKHPILRQAVHCDNIFSVGDLVTQELRFLGGELAHAHIDLVYNGIAAPPTDVGVRLESKARLQDYCENLLGYRPDYVFTHVTRLVLSKALWRDIRVLEHLDTMLAQEGKRAVHFVLSTSVPAGRRPEWVEAWEAQYGWPVGHRADNGDLIDQEVPFFFHGVEPFNQQAQQSRIVLINQFGWSRDRCGARMPEAMEFMDIRRGTDLEFGQSIYEPFGIAQVEPLPYGALCCVSSVCGCVGFVQQATAKLAQQLTAQGSAATGQAINAGQAPAQNPSATTHTLGAGLENPNVVVADYVHLPDGYWIGSPFDALGIDHGIRDWIEHNNSRTAAEQIFARLPRTPDDMARLLASGQALAAEMSWDVVIREFFLPGLENARK